MLIPNRLNVTYSTVMPDGKRFLQNRESNTVSTEVLTDSVLKTIGCDKTTVRIGENACNTVTVTNRSSTKLFRNFFKVPKPDGATYVAGSVKINGIAQPAYDPFTGFVLPDLNPGETAVVEYELKAEDSAAETLDHCATLRYTVNDPVRGYVEYTENTESLLLNVIRDQSNAQKPAYKTVTVYEKIVCVCCCPCSFCDCDC